MIVARGLGRGVAAGAIVACGLGLLSPSIIIGSRVERVRARSFIARSIMGASKL